MRGRKRGVKIKKKKVAEKDAFKHGGKAFLLGLHMVANPLPFLVLGRWLDHPYLERERESSGLEQLPRQYYVPCAK